VQLSKNNVVYSIILSYCQVLSGKHIIKTALAAELHSEKMQKKKI